MMTGNRPADGGHLIIEDTDYDDFIKNEPLAKAYLKRLMGKDAGVCSCQFAWAWIAPVRAVHSVIMQFIHRGFFGK